MGAEVGLFLEVGLVVAQQMLGAGGDVGQELVAVARGEQ